MTQEAYLPQVGNPAINDQAMQTFFQLYRNLSEEWPWQAPVEIWIDHILSFTSNSEVFNVFVDPLRQGGGTFAIRVDGLVIPGPSFSQEQHSSLLTAIQARMQFPQFVVGSQLQEGFIFTETGQRHWVGLLQTVFGPQVTIFGPQVTITFARPPRSTPPLANWPQQARTAVEQMKQHPNGLMVCCHGSWSLSQQGTIFDVFDTFPHHQQRDARMGAITEGLQALPPYESVTHLCVDGSPQSWTQAARSLVAQDIDVVVMCGHDDIEVVTQAVKLALEDRFVLVDVPHFAALDVFFWLLTELPVSATQVASVLLGVVGSYPALRRVCPHCAIEQQPEPFLLSILNQKGIPKLPNGKWVQGQGCTECYGTGFKDPRLTVAEAIYVDASLAQLCESGPSKAELHTAIVERGFQTYFQQAFTFAQQGDTTLAEAIRVGLARRAEL